MTNRNFEDLQRRCKMMNIRKLIKIVLSVFIFSLLVITIYFFYMYNLEFKENAPKQKINKITKVQIPEVIAEQKKPKKISKVKISKENKKDDYDTVFLEPTIVIPEVKVTQNTKIQKPKPRDKKIVKEEKTIKKQKEKILIQVRSLEDEESLLKENRTSESFDSTLKLSKYYLKNEKFEKAISWSKKANHYKPSSFEPWLIYAKAKIKQGKKREAIKAVETFLSYFSSSDAEKFLFKLRGEK